MPCPGFEPLLAPPSSSSSSSVPSFFGPSLQPRYRPSPLLRPLLTSPRLSPKRSPQVRCRICPLVPPGSTPCVWMKFGLCCSQPARRPHIGLTASSSTYGRRFAFRCFQLRLAATPCGWLRLPSSVPVGSFHPTRFCPCWAHWGRRSVFVFFVFFSFRRLPCEPCIVLEGRERRSPHVG